MTVIKIIQQCISMFENSTIKPQYGYCENIGDGRGYTSGIAGWVTKGGDYLNVVSRYPALRKYTSKSYWLLRLTGFQKAWVAAATDKAFCDLQDQVQETQYLQPAIQLAAKYGVTSPLGQLIFCDINIQHGMDDDSETSPGLGTMALKAAVSEVTPTGPFDEKVYLEHLLAIREKVLTSNGDVWGESVGRNDCLKTLLDQNNTQLATPFAINPWKDPEPTIIQDAL